MAGPPDAHRLVQGCGNMRAGRACDALVAIKLQLVGPCECALCGASRTTMADAAHACRKQHVGGCNARLWVQTGTLIDTSAISGWQMRDVTLNVADAPMAVQGCTRNLVSGHCWMYQDSG